MAMGASTSKRNPTKAERLSAIRRSWGILRPKAGEPSGGESLATIRAEDRAIEAEHEAMLMEIGRNRPAVQRK
jgi:hypothetical protein